MITKGERAELRSIVRQQMKVLRSEVEQREAELIADVEEQITARFADEDHTWSELSHVTHEIAMEANRKINDALRNALGDKHVERLYIEGRLPAKPHEQRYALRAQAQTQIRAKVKGALLKLQRQEADLLQNLALGALESDEARTFLAAIPTVSELVPAARLAELEASLTDEQDDA